MSEVRDAAFYRQRAADMQAQAQRAETPYLRGLYQGLAEHWATLFMEMEDDAPSAPAAEGH